MCGSASFDNVSQLNIISAINQLTSEQNDCSTAIDGLRVFRRESTRRPRANLLNSCVNVVVQGRKRLWIDNHACEYDSSNFVVATDDMPAYSEVVSASAEKPCLGFSYKLDNALITDLIASGTEPGSYSDAAETPVITAAVSAPLTCAFNRLFNALNASIQDQSILLPLLHREIHFLLLKSEAGEAIARIAQSTAQSFRITHAVDWLKKHFRKPVCMDELADRARMSPSSLYQHFRQNTGMSPLQYQKWLRLNEARRLMLNEDMDATSSAFEVGYESPSQFSREYRRLFGLPPNKDIESLRNQVNQLINTSSHDRRAAIHESLS